VLDLAVVRRFADLAADALAAHRDQINALNVFPVPDSDTGTNLYLTVAAAREALRESDAEDGPAAAEAYATGAVFGARGNSGAILAAMIRAGLRSLTHDARGTKGERLARALHAAAEAGYAAVGEPAEGTMLTALRVAADAAMAEAADAPDDDRDDDRGRDLVIEAAAAAARAELARTTSALPELRAAGVVDAGALGVTVLLDALETAFTGRRIVLDGKPEMSVELPPGGVDLDADGPAYEVMYLLEAPDETIPVLREELGGIGDSLVVVGGEGTWNVHVHVDDVGAAIEAGIGVGRPWQIRVTHFADTTGGTGYHPHAAPGGRAVVAVSAGPGLAELFRDAGAVVVEGGVRERPSVAVIEQAIVACRAAEVIVLPNDPETLRAAEAAARATEKDHGIDVVVIPTTAQVQGLAALAVHDDARPFDKDVLEMTATARHARHGAVTVAATKAITMAGPCEEGDALGVIGGDFVRVGGDLGEVARDVLGRLVGGGGELVTLVSGADDPEGALAAEAAAWLAETHPAVDVVSYAGGQERYPLLMAVE